MFDSLDFPRRIAEAFVRLNDRISKIHQFSDFQLWGKKMSKTKSSKVLEFLVQWKVPQITDVL